MLGREAEALADYGRAVELDPRFDDAWLGRGLYHFARGRYAEAVDDLDRAAALDPRNAIVHKYRALACDKVGRLREAALLPPGVRSLRRPAGTTGVAGPKPRPPANCKALRPSE